MGIHSLCEETEETFRHEMPSLITKRTCVVKNLLCFHKLEKCIRRKHYAPVLQVHCAPSTSPALAPKLCTENRCGVLLDTLIELQHLVFGQTAIIRLERESIGQTLFPGRNLFALIQVEQLHMTQ